MDDSEILARLKHEREMRELLEERLNDMQKMDRWRWVIGIAAGILISTFPGALGEVLVALFGAVGK